MIFYISRDESKNFGYTVARAVIKSLANIKKIDYLSNDNNVKLLITRVLSKNNKVINKLIANNHLFIENINYFNLILNKKKLVKNATNLNAINTLKKKELILLDEFLKLSFFGYKSHYTLDKNVNLNINFYYKWVLNEYLNNKINNHFITYKIETKIVGFCLIGMNKNALIGKLYCVHPEYRGKGIFNDLLNYTVFLASKYKKIDNIIYTTQDNNEKVTNILNKYGFKLNYSLSTFHKWYI